MRRVFAPANVALAVLGALTVALLVLAIQKQSSLSTAPALPAPAAVPPTPSAPPSVAFIGDGYTSGSPAGGLGQANYTALLAGRDGWRVTNTAIDGAGYVASPPFAEQVRRTADATPRLVVVSGGRSDPASDPAQVRDAAARLFQDLQTRLPGAKTVVIGPIWTDEDPPERAFTVRDAVRDAAAAARVPFVDPIADGWFGRDPDDLSPDGADLNDRGHGRLADLVGESIRRVGAAPN